MRNSVLVTVVAAVVAVVVVVCGILSGVSEVSSRMEMADRADAMEYVGVDTSYYAYCEAVDCADSLRMKYEFADSMYFHVKDSLMDLEYDLTLADYEDVYVPMWKLYMNADKEYRNAKYAVKHLEKTWLKAQEKYDAEITKLRNQSEDYSVLIFGAGVYIGVLFVFYLFISMMVQEMRYDKKEALERDARKNRTIQNRLTCPVWILENGEVTLKKIRVVLNEYFTERDMYENYVESCADFHVSEDMCMTFEQWRSCCE
jgi:hypothetical protein